MIAILPVSLVTAGAAALINFWLAMRIGQVRRAAGISVGDGGNDPLIRRMRAQANFVEQAPFVLILLALLELVRGPSTALWLIGVLFLVGRLLHAFGMDGWSPGRMIGTALSMVTMLGLAILAIATAARGDYAPARTIAPAETVVPRG